MIGPMTLWVLCEEHATTMPYPRWAVRSLCVIALTVCSCMIYWSGWGIVSKIGVLFFGGLMMLGVKTVWQGIRGITPSKALHARRGSWVMVYMAGMVVISYLGSFGGIHWISAGWDCISMAGLACVVCAWASCCIRHPTWAGSPSLC